MDNSNWEELAFSHDDFMHDSARLDHTLTSVLPEVDPCGFNSETLFSIREEAATISDADDSSFRETDEYQLHCRPPESEVNKQADLNGPMFNGLIRSKFNLDLPEFGIISASEKFSRPQQPAFPPGVKQDAVIVTGVISIHKDKVSPTGSILSGRENATSKTEHHHSKSAAPRIAKVNCGFLQEELVNEFLPSVKRSSYHVARVHNEHLEDNLEARSISSVGESSFRSHTLDFKSLRRRFPLKYSRSLVDDVMSVLQHLTVSGSSVMSSRRAGKKLSKASTSSLNQRIDPELPSLPDPDFTSPSTVPLWRDKMDVPSQCTVVRTVE